MTIIFKMNVVSFVIIIASQNKKIECVIRETKNLIYATKPIGKWSSMVTNVSE
jgi:hypothetical protein